MDESKKNPSTSAELVCPSCGRVHHAGERFCTDCGMPLVLPDAGESAPPGRGREIARKIDPRFTHGDLVEVAFARNPWEKDLIQNMLLEEGIPSIARSSAGTALPDVVMPGPSAIYVPESAVETARELLRRSDV